MVFPKSRADRLKAAGAPNLAANEAIGFWERWPLAWSAIIVGAAVSVSSALILGLLGISIGLHKFSADGRMMSLGDWKEAGAGAFIFTVVAAFAGYYIAGWVAGKLSGFRRAEPAALHGALTWVFSLPVLMLLIALGAGTYLGAAYGDFGRPPVPAYGITRGWQPDPTSNIEPDRPSLFSSRRVIAVAPEEARATRNGALGILTALLLGLMGAVVGGWRASGEPFAVAYERNRGYDD
jgi:hypothetical protein